jgi:peroxin-10
MGSVTYFTLSTLGGAQTLGEEYVNAMMVEGKTKRIVDLGRRFAFIFFHIVSPFLASKGYGALRRRIIASDQVRSQALQRARLRAAAVAPRQQPAEDKPDEIQPSIVDRTVSFLAAKMPSLDSINSSEGILTYLSAAHLALFYLGGKYYSAGQRLSGTEYISTIARRPGAKPPSYEVLGFLLGIQLLVKALLRANKWRIEMIKRKSEEAATVQNSEDLVKEVTKNDTDVVVIDGSRWSHKTSPPTLMLDAAQKRQRFVPLTFPDPDALPSARDLGLTKETSRNQLEAARAASKIRAAELEAISESVLKCTLCMDKREPQKGTSAVTECGHVFCWECILGWSKEKAECPLCRQSLNPSHLLPVYNF